MAFPKDQNRHPERTKDSSRYIKKLEDLIEIHALISSRLELQELLHSIVLSGIALLDTESIELWQCKSGRLEAGQNARLKLLAAEGMTQASQRSSLYLPGDALQAEGDRLFILNPRNYLEDFFQKNLPRGKSNYKKNKNLSNKKEGAPRPAYGRSVLSCIFPIQGEHRGLLTASREQKRNFGTEEEYFIERLAILAGISLQNSLHYQKTKSDFKKVSHDIRFLRKQESLLGESPVMHHLREQIRKAAPSRASILILGERGTGKEIVADLLHAKSNRKQGALIKINCAGLSEELLESELFGYEKGAFTGAEQTTPGLFEAAHKGTLFLDEIGEMSPNLQARLLRALQSGSIRRVGGRKEIPVDVRIISATNKDISADSPDFRADLFDRLSTITLRTPPLRDHPDDIELLANYFINKYRIIEEAPDIYKLSEDALACLRAYDWPGNVRELENRMHKFVIMQDEAAVFELPATPSRMQAPVSKDPNQTPSISRRKPENFQEAKARFEKDFLEQALQASRGNIARAARMTGIDRSNFRGKMKRHGLSAASFRIPMPGD